MSPTSSSPGERVLSLWRRLAPLPFGPRLFMLAFARLVPYSGALGARVVVLEPGHVRMRLAERRGVRNHLNSIHAIALANLGEMASGLAMTTALPPGVRSIVTHLSIEYAKKARGVITAESRVELPELRDDTDHAVHAELRDAAGDRVATVTVRWRLSVSTPAGAAAPRA